MTKAKLIYKILINDLSKDFITDISFRIDDFLNPTRSQCPRCKSTRLRKFSSTNTKVCDDCGFEIEWKLKPKEKPII